MKHSLKDGHGELTIDHSDSPGVTPADVAHIPGYIAVGKGEVYRTATKRCAHCGTAVILHPNRKRDRGYCSTCDAYICDNPICSKGCTPFVKLIDKIYNDLNTGKIILTDS